MSIYFSQWHFPFIINFKTWKSWNISHLFLFYRAHYKRQASEAEGQQSAESQSYVMSDNEREQIADQMRKVGQGITIKTMNELLCTASEICERNVCGFYCVV